MKAIHFNEHLHRIGSKAVELLHTGFYTLITAFLHLFTVKTHKSSSELELEKQVALHPLL